MSPQGIVSAWSSSSSESSNDGDRGGCSALHFSTAETRIRSSSISHFPLWMVVLRAPCHRVEHCMAVRPLTMAATSDHLEVPWMEIAVRSISSSSGVHLEYVGRLLPVGEGELRGGESDFAYRLELSEAARFSG